MTRSDSTAPGSFPPQSGATDVEFEALLRSRLHRLADSAPATVRLLDEVDVHSAVSRSPRRSRRRAAGIGASIAALVGAIGFSTVALNGAGDGGAATPEEAVTRFVGALEHEDVLGVIDVLDPSEVPVLRSVFETAAVEAKRTGVVSDGFSLDGVAGVDLQITDLSVSSDRVADNVAIVRATSGSISASLDTAAFPMGDAVRELIGDQSAAVSTANAEFTTGDPIWMLATVKRSGRWYVSVGFTLAEYARAAAAVDFPSEPAVTPEGFASPEAAVSALYERLVSFDFAGAVATAAPGEGDALARYAGLWLPSATNDASKWRESGFDVTISDVGFSVVGDGERRVVTATSFVIDGTVPPSSVSGGMPSFDPSLPTMIYTYDGGFVIIPAGEPLPASIDGLPLSTDMPPTEANYTDAAQDGSVRQLPAATRPGDPAPHIRIERRDGCTTWTGAPASAMFAESRTGFEKIGEDTFRSCTEMPVGFSALWLVGIDGLSELPPIATVQIDGKWYVSPIGTVGQMALGLVNDMPEGGSLFDTQLGLYLYGGNRASITAQYVGLDLGSVDQECRAILTDDGSVITGVVAHPSPADIRACGYGGSFGSTSVSSSGSVSSGSVVEVAPASTAVAAAPVEAPTPASTLPFATTVPIASVSATTVAGG
jgi:hypothetical protein